MDKWFERDLAHIWHPFTQMKDIPNFPLIFIKKAKGIKLYDDQNHAYFDTISSWWCNIHGHGHPSIMAALRKQTCELDHVLFAGFTHENAIRLSEEITALMPKLLSKVFFSDNGSTAVEVALKMAYQYWAMQNNHKTTFLSLDAGYHGDTIGTMSVSGQNSFNARFRSLCFPSLAAPAPYCYRCPFGSTSDQCQMECANELEKIMHKNHQKIAAMIIEPMVLAAGGMIVYPKIYLDRVGELCKKYDILLIADEVATGFGRTARMFAFEHSTAIPDFVCLSKGLTSGVLPMALTVTTDKIYNAFYDDHDKNKTFFHGHTFTANPLASAVGVASLDVFKKEGTLNHVQNLELYFHDQLDQFLDVPIVGDVRSIGFIGALELVSDKKRKIPVDPNARIGLQIYKKGLENGIILRPIGNVIYLFLPLCTTKNQIKTIISRLKLTLSAFDFGLI